jgi:DNA-binding response OmpR family regulator
MCANVSMIRRQLLIVDDDPSIRTLLRLVAERRGISADVAADGVEALQRLAEARYELAIIDLMMPRVNGYDLVSDLRGREDRPAVIIATAMTDSLLGQLDPEVVHSIIRKPFDIEIVGGLMTAILAPKNPPRQPEADVAHENVAHFPPNDSVC